MTTRSANFHQSNPSFNLFAYLVRLFLTIVIFVCLLAGLWFLDTISAQSEQTMSFGSGKGLQFIDPDGENSVPFWLKEEYEAINFTLYPLSETEFLGQYATYTPSYSPWYSVTPIDTTSLISSTTWSQIVPPDDSYYRAPSVPITMPTDTPAGIYIIQADAPDDNIANSIIVVSRNVLVLKRGINGQIVAWASALQDGTPAVDMEVTLYDINSGEVIDQGQTDEKGVVELNLKDQSAQDGSDIIAIATHPTGDLTVAGLSYDWQVNGSSWWWSAQNRDQYRLYLYTDRPVYRPGHTIYFDAIARNNGLDGYTPIAPSTVMTATLRDGRNNLIDTQILSADEYGTANGSFTLGDEVVLGNYYMALQVGEQTQYQSLKVEEYVKPEYSVEVSTPDSFAIEGEAVPITVDAAYFFGQPVTDAKVKVKIYRQNTYNYYWWSDDYYYSPYWYENQLIDTLEGTTDSQGQWTTMLEPSTNGNKYGATYTIVAEVTDAQEKAIQGQHKLKIYFNEFNLSIHTARYGYIINEPIEVTVQTRAHDGTAYGNQTVDVNVISHRDGDEQAVQTLQAVTDADGNATVTFEGVPHGWYYLTATTTDSQGRTMDRTRYLCIYDPNARSWWWWGNNSDKISIQADKDSYAPGETAHLLIQSRIESGTGLLTLEREGIYDEILVNLDGPVTMVDVPITENYGPNIYASFHLFQRAADTGEGLGDVGNREGNLITAQIEMEVEQTGKKLNLEITADADKYRPSQEAQLTFTLTDNDGQPTAGRISVAIVDEALFALQEELSADLFTTFYRRGSHRVDTYQSLTRSPYWYWPYISPEGIATNTPMAAATNTPQPDSEAANDSGDDSQPRRNFQDTAYWNPIIDVGEDGTAIVTVPLPDNLTTWRITARAVTKDTRIGTAISQLLVTKEIISRPTLPRFAVTGDLFSLRAVGQNYSGVDLQGEALIESNHLVILNPGVQTLDMPNTKSAVGRWTAVASHVGTGLVTSTLRTSEGQDIVELPLRTKPFSAPERWVASGEANPQATETFTMSLNAIHESSELTLHLSPSIALGLLDGLDDLIRYPYGCVEQTMSRVLPGAVAIQVYNELDLPNPKADEIPEIVSKGLQKLYGYQQNNGGWGWFYDDNRALYLTSYVLLGLTMVQEAGFEVETSVLDRGFSSLDSMLRSGDEEGNNDDMRAFALYVKALAGQGDLEMAQELALNAETLRTDSLAMLALALHLDDDETGAQELTDELLERVSESSNMAYWSTGEDGYDWYYWRTMASRDKYTAIAVRTLATLRPDSPVLPKAVRWLMNNRRGTGWRNTQATAFAVLGLLDYIKLSGELESNYNYTISINDVEVANGQVTPENVTEPIEPLVITGDGLQIGQNQLTISRTEQIDPGTVHAASIAARNPLYYTAKLEQERFYDSFTEITSAQEGLTLSRSYTLVEGEPREDGAYNMGDTVEVTLDLKVDQEVSYLLIEDPIPAGFEALNERLNPTTYGSGHSWFSPWRSWGYNRKDIRDDRVDFFITRARPGERTLTYLMRATIPGTFSVLPGQAYPMYDDDMWARSTSLQVTVVPELLEDRPLLAGDFDNDCRVTGFDALQVTGQWGTNDSGSDLIADGAVDLTDMAAALQRRGMDCNTVTGAVAVEPATEEARILLSVEPPTVNAARSGAEGELRAYITARDVNNLGGFEFLVRYNRNVVSLQDMALDDSIMGGDVLALGPIISNNQGKITFGAFDARTASEHQDSLSGVQQIIANARSSRRMAQNGQVLATLNFQTIGEGDPNIRIEQAQAIDGDGLLLAVNTAEDTPTPMPTDTPTPTNTPTLTSTSTDTPTPTNTPTSTSTDTPMPTDTPTSTSTDMPTPTNTPIPTPIDTLIPTITPMPTLTLTPVPTNTIAATPPDTATPTPTDVEVAAPLTPTVMPTGTPDAKVYLPIVEQ